MKPNLNCPLGGNSVIGHFHLNYIHLDNTSLAAYIFIHIANPFRGLFTYGDFLRYSNTTDTVYQIYHSTNNLAGAIVGYFGDGKSGTYH